MTEVGTYRRYGEAMNLQAKTLEIIDLCDQLLQGYERAGYVMSVRQVFYQFVSKGWMPNNEKTYNSVQSALNVGRMQGLISWTALEDRERALMGLPTQTSPAKALAALRREYRIDLWHNQPWRPEVWVEKKALVGVVERICARMRVDFFGCKGYSSQSEQWRAGQRMAGRIRGGQRPIVFHLGDHDPSGIDMTRDNEEKLRIFTGTPVIVQRLALNMPQIEELQPPPNPAKMTDSRAADYVRQWGHSSWELDALDPPYIERLIEDAILKIRDPELWDEALAEENSDLSRLDLMIEDLSR